MARRKKKSGVPRFLFFLLLLALAVGAGVLHIFPRGAGSGEPVRVVIPSGASLRNVSDSLANAGVVRSALLFRLYATRKESARAVRPGTYRFRPGASWDSVLDSLTSGRGVTVSITIPEGFALSAIEPLIATRLKVPADSVAAAVRDTALLRRLDIPTPHLEGYLYPDTYVFSEGSSARVVVRTMVERFEEQWDPAWDARLLEMAMSRHDIVTLASIVEKEARVADERPIIAAVYHNRLRIGMPLQADPTVQYARGQHTNRVLHRDLEIESPYNTYRNPNLPPGPIASPGRPSIEASLFPADVPYRFFVAHPDGHHIFRRTFEEHVQARQELQRERARRERAAPPR